jgi:hypothetical protein
MYIIGKKAEKARGKNAYNGLGKNAYLVASDPSGSYPVWAKNRFPRIGLIP